MTNQNGYGFSENEVKAIQKYNQGLLVNLMEWIGEEKEKLSELEAGAEKESELSPEDEEAVDEEDEELELDNNADKNLEELDADTLENNL